MKDFIIIVLVTTTMILFLSAAILSMHKEAVDTYVCKKYEHISGIKTASFDGTCYKFVNDRFVEVDFKEIE